MIIMDDAANHVSPLDRPGARRTGQWDWTLLPQSLTGRPLIIIGDIVRQYAAQVAHVQDDRMAQALLAGRADPPFGNAVGPRLTRRRLDDRQPFTSAYRVEARWKLRISIVQ